MKSLPPGIQEIDITNKIAASIVAMPCEIGINPKSNTPIIKDIGRYGPYIKCGSQSRSVTAPIDILNITIDQAIELLEKDQKGPSVLKDLGEEKGQNIVVKKGRYGIYVTNGKVNVTLPKDQDYHTLDLNTALTLIKNKKSKKKFKRN